MQWRAWTSMCSMEGKFESRWRSMVDLSTHTVHEGVPTTAEADIVLDRREEGHTPQDAILDQDPGLQEDVAVDLDQGHQFEGVTDPAPTLLRGHAQEVMSGEDQDLQVHPEESALHHRVHPGENVQGHQVPAEENIRDLVLVQENDLVQPPPGALHPHAGLCLLEDLILLHQTDLKQEKPPNLQGRTEKTLAIFL